MLQSIECPECKRLPFFDIDFQNNHCLIKYKCHNNKFEEISLDKFINFSDPIKCKVCKSKNIDYWTRIIGYLRPVSAFSNPRKIEQKKRVYSKNDDSI